MSSSGIQCANFFLLRTPALPSSHLAGLRKLFDDTGSIRKSELIQSRFVQEAIYLASSRLYDQLYRNSSPEMFDERLEMAVGRYLFRMCTRCTPFGLFAGVSTGRIGSETRLEVSESETSERVTRIDLAVIGELRNALLKREYSPELLRGAKLMANDTLWSAPDGLRIVEEVWGERHSHYRLARIEKTPAIEWLLAELGSGGDLLENLAGKIVDRFSATIAEAELFLTDLLREQVLICIPPIGVTNEAAIEEFTRTLHSIEATRDPAASLKAAIEHLSTVGTNSAANIEIYEEVGQRLRDTGVDVDQARSIQVDLHKSSAIVELPRGVVNVVASQLWALRGLFMTDHPAPALDAFARKFSAQFGGDAVPLTMALDEDFGVTFGQDERIDTPLIPDEWLRATRPPEAALDRIGQFLLRRSLDAILQGEREIELSETDLEALSLETVDMPSSFSVIGYFSAEGVAALANGKFTFDVEGIGGVPGTSLFGRFCFGDRNLTELVRTFIEGTEQDTTDTIFAEIAHLPEGRFGNIVLRPVLRPYEIVYLGGSGVPPDHQIKLSDLYLRCAGEKLELFSPKLGKRVIPRISNAYNHGLPKNLPTYRFLAQLQGQYEPQPRNPWSGLAEFLPFIPGLRYGNVRLSRPVWRLSHKETKAIAQLRESDNHARFNGLLKHGAVAQRVKLRVKDNFLELDLSEKLDRHLLIEECRRKDVIELEETAASSDIVTTADGRGLRHEVVIPFVRSSPTSWPAAICPPSISSACSAMPPGGSWLYVRIFGGSLVLDQLVIELYPEFRRLAAAEGCTKTFFIRYNEGGSHLRLRTSGDSKIVWSVVRSELEELLKRHLDARYISRFEYATYQPETRRYGGEDALHLCEQIFEHDSVMVSDVLRAFSGRAEFDNERWRIALCSMHQLLQSFELGVDGEIAVARELAASYSARLRIEQRQLNMLYRTHRSLVDQITREAAHPDAEVEAILRNRRSAIQPQINALKDTLEMSRLLPVIKSLVHMSANRILLGRSVAQEMVLLHFTAKSLSSHKGKKAFQERQQQNRALSY